MKFFASFTPDQWTLIPTIILHFGRCEKGHIGALIIRLSWANAEVVGVLELSHRHD